MVFHCVPSCCSQKSSVRQSSYTGGNSMKNAVFDKCCIALPPPKSIKTTSQNRSKNRPKSISEVIKGRLGKRLASQAPQKRIFYNFWLPKGTQKSIKIHQKALTIIGGNHFWALRVAIYRCGALRTRFWTDLGWILERFCDDFFGFLDFGGNKH